MFITRPVTFVVTVNNREVFESNFLASPIFGSPHPHQISVQEGFGSAAEAYNEALARSENDLIVFAHQDVIFPMPWLSQLQVALENLEEADPAWGVLGCYGRTRENEGRGNVYTSGLGILGEPFSHPIPVQTLDEIVLILRKSSGLRFDNTLPNFHMYGADICMAAAKHGMKSYAIPAFCIHNTVFNLVLPKEFYDCYKHVQLTWKEFLPIQTTCVRITRSGLPMHRRRLRELYLKYVLHKRVGATRAMDVQQLLDTVTRTQADSPEESPCQIWNKG